MADPAPADRHDHRVGQLAAVPRVVPGQRRRRLAVDDAAFDGISDKVRSALEEALRTGVSDTYQLQQVVRRTVGGWAGRSLRRRPMILPTVVEA